MGPTTTTVVQSDGRCFVWTRSVPIPQRHRYMQGVSFRRFVLGLFAVMSFDCDVEHLFVLDLEACIIFVIHDLFILILSDRLYDVSFCLQCFKVERAGGVKNRT